MKQFVHNWHLPCYQIPQRQVLMSPPFKSNPVFCISFQSGGVRENERVIVLASTLNVAIGHSGAARDHWTSYDMCSCAGEWFINSLRPRQNGRNFPDDIFKWIFLNDENVWISINISLKFVPRGPINNIPTLVKVMARRRPMMVRLPTHICVTRPQWV